MKRIIILIIMFLLNTHFVLSQSTWFWQNPLPQGNNLFDIQVIDSEIAYSCGDCGTILKTTNQGNNWIIIKSDQGYSSNSLNFINSNTGFIVNTKIESNVIVPIWLSKITKTTNGGFDWNTIALLHNTLIHNIEFCGKDTGYLFGEENFSDYSDGIIYKTIDGGANWFRCYTGLHINESYFLNSLTGYACGNSIYITTDGGINWTQQYSGNNVYNSITFINISTGFAVGYLWHFPPNPNEPKIWKTTNGGIYWSESNTVNNIYFEKIKFINENTGLVSGSNNLYKTTNIGLNWINVTPPNMKSKSIDFVSTGTGFIVGDRGLILKSQDYGNNWIDLFPSLRTGGLIIVRFWNKNIGYATDDARYIYKTTNGGQTWLIQKEQISLPFYDLAIIDSNNVYAAGGDTEFRSLIMKTTNGGNDWITLNSTFGKPITSISFINNNTGYLSGEGYLIKTTNGGNTFIDCTPVSYSYKICFVNKDTGYVGGYTNIYKTTDGAVTWITQPGFIVTAIYFLNSDTGFSAEYDNVIKKTTNGGLMWSTKYIGTGGVRIHDIKFLNNNIGYAVGDKGTILMSTNEGENWYLQPSPSDYRFSSISMVDNDISYIGGIGSVILCSTNGGNPVGIEQVENYIPTLFSISQNYPNPFNPVTHLEFGISDLGFVSLKVYDILGKEVKTLVKEIKPAGNYRVEFDGSNFASGVYFYRLESGDFVQTKRMVLIK